MNKKDRLKKFLIEAQEFLGKNLTCDDSKFKAWNNALIRFSEREFGEKSTTTKVFKERYYTLVISGFDTPRSSYVRAFETDLKTTIEDLKMLIDEVDDYDIKPIYNPKKSNNKNNPINVTINNSNNNTNRNDISNDIIVMDIEKIKETIEDNSYLDDKSKKELLSKLNELLEIQQSNESKTKRWNKVKPILTFILDKGADIAIMFLPHIIKAISQ